MTMFGHPLPARTTMVTLAVALAAVFSAVGIAFHQVPGTTGPAPPPAAGFSPGSSILWESDAELARELDSMRATGATWLRLDFPWSVIETQQGTFDWSVTDRVVDAAQQRGLDVLALPAYTPAWARPPGTDSDKFPPSDPRAFATFVRAAAERYAGRIDAWEIWNEPNIAPVWRPQPDAGAYAALLVQAHAAIKQVDPGATVIAGGLSPAVDAPDGSQIAPATFLQALYQAGAQGSFDAVGVHPYSFPARPSDASTASWNTFYRLPLIHDVMRQYGDGDKQIWMTEFGAPTGTSANAVTEAEQAAIVDDAFTMVEQWPWAGPLLWYAGRDSGTDPADREQNFGLLRHDFTPKPALARLTARLGAESPPTTVAPPPPTTAPPTTVTVPPPTTTPETTTTTSAPPTTTTTPAVSAPLAVSDVRVSEITATSAVVTWTTNVAASSEVDYGIWFPRSVAHGPRGVTSHRVEIDDLRRLSIYSFRVESRSPSGEIVTSRASYFATALR